MCVVVTDDDVLANDAAALNRPEQCVVVRCGARHLSSFFDSFAMTHAVVDERHATLAEVRAIVRGVEIDSASSADSVLALVRRIADTFPVP